MWMLKVTLNGSVSLTRGDTAYLTVPMVFEDSGEPYEMGTADTLTLSVKKTVKDTEFAFRKIVVGDNTFHIKPEDTADLPFGKYKYDIQLDTENGDVFTVTDISTFEVLPEVG